MAENPFKLPDTRKWGRPDWGMRVPLRDKEKLDIRDWLVGRAGEILDSAPNLGLTPRGAVVDPATPEFPFEINDKDHCWAETAPALYELAKASQWNPTTDIPWHQLEPLPDDVERAICQLMTFLIENEYVALYLPAKFLPRINPHYTEVVLLLATQVVDEARHIDVYTKRALANGGGLQYVSASTEWSLKSLMNQEDYLSASFLLHMLGEGTFQDLLKFIEAVAPDPVTKEILRRTAQDESRHVGYGMGNVTHALKKNPSLAKNLLEAAEERASFLRETSGFNPFVQEALAILAGGGSDPSQTQFGARMVRELYKKMHDDRVVRLTEAGFDKETAIKISELHGTSVKTFM